MSHAFELNQTLMRHHPAAHYALTELGRNLYFPAGVPHQAREAKNCRINATIGQCTDDLGQAMPLQTMAKHIVGLSSKDVFLYTPQGGRVDLRNAWRERVVEETNATISLPVVCSGLTHGLSICADLFIDKDVTVLLPSPRWGNYDLLFGIRPQSKIVNYNVLGGTGSVGTWTWDVSSIADALSAASGRTVLVLNVPSNPIGYTPTESEVDDLIAALESSKSPVTIVLDEAYHGMEWEDACYKRSLLAKLKHLDPERFLVVKIDGATKEFFFFGGRVAFLSFLTPEPSAAVLEEKVIAGIRSSISALSSPSQALLMAALSDPDHKSQQQEQLGLLRKRYLELKRSVAEHGLTTYPFNSAFFALVPTRKNSELLRKDLLKQGLGVVSIPSGDALRISYSTVPAAMIPEMVDILAKNLT